MWFTETPWPPIVVCAGVAAVLAVRWAATRRGIHLVGVGIALSVAAVVFIVERQIVTPAEEVENRVDALMGAVVAGDSERVVEFFSQQAPVARGLVAGAMRRYRVKDDARITDLRVETRAEDSMATSHFRANGVIESRRGGIAGHGPTRWRLTWGREEDRWVIREVQRLDPITGEEMALLAPVRR